MIRAFLHESLFTKEVIDAVDLRLKKPGEHVAKCREYGRVSAICPDMIIVIGVSDIDTFSEYMDNLEKIGAKVNDFSLSAYYDSYLLAKFKDNIDIARENILSGMSVCNALCSAFNSHKSASVFSDIFAPYAISQKSSSVRVAGCGNNYDLWLGGKTRKNRNLRLCFLDCFEAWATHEISGFVYKEF